MPGFGVQGWHAKFAEVDMRDSETIEKIRDIRLRKGSWTLDKYRAMTSGSLRCRAGTSPSSWDRQNIVLWADMPAACAAGIAAKVCAAPALIWRSRRRASQPT